MGRGKTTFVLRQRAYLKLYMIHKAEQEHLYGHQILEDLRKHFQDLGYRPTHSEVYKSLHELYHEGYLARRPMKKVGTEMQTLYLYRIADKEKVKAYKETLRYDLERSAALLNRALRDNYGQKRQG